MCVSEWVHAPRQWVCVYMTDWLADCVCMNIIWAPPFLQPEGRQLQTPLLFLQESGNSFRRFGSRLGQLLHLHKQLVCSQRIQRCIREGITNSREDEGLSHTERLSLGTVFYTSVSVFLCVCLGFDVSLCGHEESERRRPLGTFILHKNKCLFRPVSQFVSRDWLAQPWLRLEKLDTHFHTHED